MNSNIIIYIVSAAIFILIIMLIFGIFKKHLKQKETKQKKLDSFIKSEVKKSCSRTGKSSDINIDKIIWEISDSIDLTANQKNRIIRDLERLKGE